jgi:glycosyltransferase involved in cell wall biosynthesis
VYNGEQFLEETILSVINQTYDNVEYIIIDGGSTDGTLDIIKKYEHAIDYWVSEKDKGIYDAMNRGIDLATGEWINFMNAGDVFASSKVIHPIFTTEKIDNASLVFGKSITFYQNLEVLRYEDFNSTNKKFYLTKMPNHQAVFVQKCIYKKIKYNLSYKFFADTVYLRECFSQAEFYEFSGVVSRFELGGVSSFYGKYSNFIGLVKDSQILTGKKISPFIKHFVKYTMQKILGKDLYLKFYIKRVL